MMIKKLAIIIVAILVSACSNPKDTTIPTKIGDMDSIKPALEKLTEEERVLVAGYVMRHTVGSALSGLLGQKSDPIPEGMTIGKAISEQQAFIANRSAEEEKQKRQKETAKAEEEKALSALRNAVSAKFVSKGIKDERGRSGIEIDKHLLVIVSFTNHTEKPVAAVKGTIDIEDLFGDKVTGFAITNSETIAPRDTIAWTGSRSVKYSLSSDRDLKFSEMDDSKFKAVWKPEAIVFSDGTKLSK